MRESGQWVDVAGRCYQARRYGKPETELWIDSDSSAVPESLVTDRGDLHGRVWVKVPSGEVRRRWYVDVTALWRGERVKVDWLSADARKGEGQGAVRVSTYSQRFGREHGWQGSTYDGGWWAEVSLDELSDVQEERAEAPAGGRLDNEG